MRTGGRYFGIISLSLVALCPVLCSSSKDKYREYVAKYSSIAVSEMERTGVPASITMAQALLESAAGESKMAREANNHFGIKCHRDWKGGTGYYPAESGDECFRVYPKVEDSYRDHSDFLRYQSRYKSLFDLDKTDYKGWAEGLKKAGYATDSSYPAKLVRIIEEYDLSRLDGNVEVSVEAPSVVEAPLVVAQKEYQEILNVPLIRKIYVQNGVPFVYAVEGDSYASLASSFNLFKDEILRLNDVNSDAFLSEGDRVYLKPKKKAAAKGIDKYIVGPGETISVWDISQKYAVKLSSICRMNNLQKDAALEEGDTIILR